MSHIWLKSCLNTVPVKTLYFPLYNEGARISNKRNFSSFKFQLEFYIENTNAVMQQNSDHVECFNFSVHKIFSRKSLLDCIVVLKESICQQSSIHCRIQCLCCLKISVCSQFLDTSQSLLDILHIIFLAKES
jgi:hypothetical protein